MAAAENTGGSAVRRRRWPFVLALAALAALFVALALWQVERRGEKLALIARVAERVDAAPVPAPGPSGWRDVTRERDEYRRVRADGVFDHGAETLVQALTERGAGFWVLTPLRRPDGTALLVNRGFVPADLRDPAARADGQVAGPVAVTGLLRLTEPGGAFLRSNDPAAGRWFSRDVSAIAAARGLAEAAPYFVDADARPNPGGWPLGGLTIVRFPNSHLVYALTWSVLALMAAGAAILVLRSGRDGVSGRRVPTASRT